MGEPLVKKVWLREMVEWQRDDVACHPQSQEGDECSDSVRSATTIVDSIRLITEPDMLKVAVAFWNADRREAAEGHDNWRKASSSHSLCRERVLGWYWRDLETGLVPIHERECAELPKNLPLETEAIRGWIRSNAEWTQDIADQFVEVQPPPSLRQAMQRIKAEAATPVREGPPVFPRGPLW